MLAIAGYKLALCVGYLRFTEGADMRKYRLVIMGAGAFAVIVHLVFILLNFLPCMPVCSFLILDIGILSKLCNDAYIAPGGKGLQPKSPGKLSAFPDNPIPYCFNQYFLRRRDLSTTDSAFSQAVHRSRRRSWPLFSLRLRAHYEWLFDCSRNFHPDGRSPWKW